MKENNLIRKLGSCETMGCVDIICTDKTGTLTKNDLALQNVWNGDFLDISNLPNFL